MIPKDNLAELLEKLGNVPLQRIRMRPSPGTATEEDVVAALALPHKRICELIDGVLVEKAMGFRESRLATILGRLLDVFVTDRNLGLVTGPDGTIRLWPGRIRIPDLAFFAWNRLPDRRMPRDPIPQVSPDLAVEILSQSNTRDEIRLKRLDYFRVGVCLLWEIDPVARTVTVYTSFTQADTVLREADQLDAGAVLAGFTLSLEHLFAELDRHG